MLQSKSSLGYGSIESVLNSNKPNLEDDCYNFSCAVSPFPKGMAYKFRTYHVKVYANDKMIIYDVGLNISRWRNQDTEALTG